MSNLTQLIAATGPVVSPGTVTSSQYYTSVGWTAGEYIYSTPTGTIAPRTTGGLGYNGTYNAGAVLFNFSSIPGTLQTVQYGPLFDYGTFSGTTQTIGSQSGSSTTIASVVGDIPYSFNLINGNICIVYLVSGVPYFTIVTPAGATVLAATAVAGASSVTANRYALSGCCLINGTIVITYSDASNSYWVSYTQTGTVVTTATAFYLGTAVRYHQTIALANGNWAVVGSSSNGTQYLIILSPTGTVVRSLIQAGLAGMEHGVCCQLPNGNIAYGGYDQNNSRIGVGVITQAGVQVWSTYPSGSSAQVNNILPLPSGNFAFIYTNSSGQGTVSIYSGTANNNLANYNLGSTNISSGCVGALQLSSSLVPSIIVVGTSGASGSLYRVTCDSTTGATGTISTINSSISTVNAQAWIVNSLNGKVHLTWEAVTTSYPTYGFWNVVALTNGSTVLYGANYTPKENWFLLGVAATTVAAGNTGPVITNGGSVTLNANYPTVTTPIAFNYQGSFNTFAQRGTVVNKVAVLKGLEL
jgi:hypothetical protein